MICFCCMNARWKVFNVFHRDSNIPRLVIQRNVELNGVFHAFCWKLRAFHRVLNTFNILFNTHLENSSYNQWGKLCLFFDENSLSGLMEWIFRAISSEKGIFFLWKNEAAIPGGTAACIPGKKGTFVFIFCLQCFSSSAWKPSPKTSFGSKSITMARGSTRRPARPAWGARSG